MLLTEIKWSQDDDMICNLPTEVRVNINMDPDDVADWLSDMYGYCVIGFCCQP